MTSRIRKRVLAVAVFILVAVPVTSSAQNAASKKVYMITDMEGVDGIFDTDLQCIPFKSPRFDESRKLLTGEVNAAVDGLFEGGATDVVVWDGHDASETLSTLDLNPRARLLGGEPVSPTLELDSSYYAVVFIGQHAMAGAPNAILSHTYSSEGIQNIWVNNRPTGEIGARVMLAGSFGIPVIMLSGDAAACREIHELVPNAVCAEVKSGVSRTAGFSLSHAAACALIREKARQAMEHRSEIKPYTLTGPVEVKVEFTPHGTHEFRPREGVERLDARTWLFRGKDLKDAWLKYSSF